MTNYKIVRLTHMAHPDPFLAFYKNNPEMALLPYEKQQQIIYEQSLVYSNGFSEAMKALGNEAHEIIFDLEPLQKTWAKDTGLHVAPDSWQTEILLEQLKHYKPEIVYFQSTNPLPKDVRLNLKSLAPSIRLSVLYKGYPYGFDEIAGSDLLFVGTPTMVDRFRGMGPEPLLLYHSFDRAILRKMDIDATTNTYPLYEFTFVGSSGLGYGLGHQSRYWMLVELIRNTGLELWIHERATQVGLNLLSKAAASVKGMCRSSLSKALTLLDTGQLLRLVEFVILPRQIRTVIGQVLDQREQPTKQVPEETSDFRIPKKSLSKWFPDRCRPPVYGQDYFKVLRDSKVSLNRHTDAAEDCVGNMRLFEATGVGSCLLTDTGRNMSDLFEPDSEVVTYDSTEECIEKAKYLLEHDKIRCGISAAGQKRTLRDHTTLNRCEQLDEIFQRFLRKRC